MSVAAASGHASFANLAPLGQLLKRRSHNAASAEGSTQDPRMGPIARLTTDGDEIGLQDS